MLAGELVYQILKARFNELVFPAPRPEQAEKGIPYVTFQEISESPLNTVEAYTGHDLVRMQINVYAFDSYIVKTLGKEIAHLMTEQNQLSCEFLGARSDYDEETKLRSRQLDFYIFQSC